MVAKHLASISRNIDLLRNEVAALKSPQEDTQSVLEVVNHKLKLPCADEKELESLEKWINEGEGNDMIVVSYFQIYFFPRRLGILRIYK